MNFKTTVLLIALLAIVGCVLYFTRDRGTNEITASNATKTEEKKLLDIATDVNKLSIGPADG